MIGRSTDIIVPEDRRMERDALVARALAGEHVVGFETIRVCKDGRRIPVSLTASVVRDSTGRVSGISFIERDITVLKQLHLPRTRRGAGWTAVGGEHPGAADLVPLHVARGAASQAAGRRAPGHALIFA